MNEHTIDNTMYMFVFMRMMMLIRWRSSPRTGPRSLPRWGTTTRSKEAIIVGAVSLWCRGSVYSALIPKESFLSIVY